MLFKKLMTNIMLPFWILLMAVLYLGQNINALIIATFVLALIYFSVSQRKVILSKDDIPILLFIFYYLTITLLNGQNIMGIVIRFICLPVIVAVLTPKERQARIKLLKQFRNFIGLTAIYGVIEYLIHFNYMVYFVKIDAVEWMITMNNALFYYTSSIFLHYTYFSYVLLLGFILELVLPYRRKWLSLLYRFLLIIAIFLCQSRIVWIALLFVLLINWLIYTPKIRIEQGKLIKGMIIFVCLLVFSVVFNVFQFLLNYITQRFTSLFSYGLSDGSLGQRFGTLQNWGQYFDVSSVRAIFGSGFGGISDYLRTYSYFSGYSTADSTITIVLVEAGIVGLVLLVLSLIGLLVQVIRARSPFSRLVLLLVIGSLWTSLTIDFTANYVVLYLFYVVLIVSLMLIRSDER
ncbi:MAG: O-antigen ligase family protein [Streptococcus hyointestinalis]|nr:O-antigen ligase family protein [Streptococcus hyointestinalis]MDY4553039.1 O-antigen ligase family protein [Streptococcus hyointestinalis]